MPTRTLTVTHPSPTELRIQRTFDAPRRPVWEAHTEPEYIHQWLLGPDGWSMPVCEFDAHEGGTFRYEWLRDETGERMAMGGTILEFSPIERIVATEKFDEAWYPGEAVNTSEFAEAGAGAQTTLTVTSRFESEAALKTASATDMVDGMAFTYDRLAALLGTLAANGDLSSGELDITYDVVELPEQRVGYLRGTLAQAQELWGQTHTLTEDILYVAGVESASIMPSEALGGPGPDMQYDTAMFLPDGVGMPSDLTPGALPAGRYARATFAGSYDDLGAAWGEFLGSWLPASGERQGVTAAFELYRVDGQGDSPPVTELYIPIE